MGGSPLKGETIESYGNAVLSAGFMTFAIAALVMAILVVTLPFAVASWRIAVYTIWPFGRTVVPRPDAGVPSQVGNVLWFVLAGWWLGLLYLLAGALACVLAATAVACQLVLGLEEPKDEPPAGVEEGVWFAWLQA